MRSPIGRKACSTRPSILPLKSVHFFIAHANQAVSHENGFIATTLELSIDVKSVLALYKQINFFFPPFPVSSQLAV